MEPQSSRRKLICCEVFFREICEITARSPHRIDVEFLPKGLHDMESAQMRARLQEAIDRTEEGEHEAILLGYGLCNNGLAGVQARSAPIILPRAHDCITLFLGCRARYRAHFDGNPGTYYLTSGWIERGEVSGDLKNLSIQHKTGMDLAYEDLVARYGEDNARYLAETLGNHSRNYRQFTFIEMGTALDDRFERHARDAAAERGWTFEKVSGDVSLLRGLVDGPWPEEKFLTIPPGHAVRAVYDDDLVVTAEPAES